MARALSEAEEAARKKYDGMTRREYKAKHSKFKSDPTTSRKGNFVVAALFYGNDTPQPTSFPVIGAALAHFDKLSKNANVSVLKLIEYTPKLDKDGNPTNESKASVLHQLNKTNQQFANSKVEHIWRRPDALTEYRKKAIENNDDLMRAFLNNGLVLSRSVYYDGNPWWATAKDRTEYLQ